MEFFRPEYWSGQPFPSPGDLPNPGIKARYPTQQADSLPADHKGSPKETLKIFLPPSCKTRRMSSGLDGQREGLECTQNQFNSVQSLSCVQLLVTPWTAARQASQSITNSWSILKLKSIMSVMPSNHLILCCPLLLPPSIFPSIRAFSSEWVLHIRWPKYWSFSFSISPSNEYSGLISFRTDWFGFLAAQGTLKNPPQHDCCQSSTNTKYYSTQNSKLKYKSNFTANYFLLLCQWI